MIKLNFLEIYFFAALKNCTITLTPSYSLATYYSYLWELLVPHLLRHLSLCQSPYLGLIVMLLGSCWLSWLTGWLAAIKSRSPQVIFRARWLLNTCSLVQTDRLISRPLQTLRCRKTIRLGNVLILLLSSRPPSLPRRMSDSLRNTRNISSEKRA